MKLSIELEMPPAPKAEPTEKPTRVRVEDRVRECLECVESGHDSWREWILLSNMYKALLNMGKKRNSRAENILQMIEPVMRKYGYSGVGADT